MVNRGISLNVVRVIPELFVWVLAVACLAGRGHRNLRIVDRQWYLERNADFAYAVDQSTESADAGESLLGAPADSLLRGGTLLAAGSFQKVRISKVLVTTDICCAFRPIVITRFGIVITDFAPS
jgi:hypothetical protein